MRPSMKDMNTKSFLLRPGQSRFVVLVLLLFLPMSSAAQSFDGFGGYLIPGGRVRPSELFVVSPLNLFVAVGGNDTNDCLSVGSPCLTCQGALNKIPKTLRSPTSVTLGSGTFAGCNIEGFSMESLRAANVDTTHPAMLLLQGTLSNFTVATGTATGTLTAFTAETATAFAIATDGGQAWTVNNLQGRFFVTTGGTGSGQTLAIASNTATTVTLAGTVTALDATTTYAIQDPATTLNAVVSPGTAAVVVSDYARSIQPTNANQHVIRFLKFTGAIRGVEVETSGHVTVQNSRFENSSIGGVVSIASNGLADILVNRCTFAQTVPGVSVQSNPTTVNGSVYVGSGASATFISANTTRGAMTTARNQFVSGVGFINVLGATWDSTRDRITTGTGICADIGDNASTSRAGLIRFSATNSDFSSCTLGGVRASGRVNGLLSSVTGTGNGVGGIIITDGAIAEFTSGTTLTGPATCTDGGGGAGTGAAACDFIVQGITRVRGTIEAATPKSVFDLNFGTMVYER